MYKDKKKYQNYQKKYREKNKEKAKKYRKDYWEKNKEKLLVKNRETGKIWYQKNKERNLERGRKWQRNNRKRAVEIVQKYVSKNKEKVKIYQKNFEQSFDGKYRLIKHRHQKRWKYELFTLNEFIELSSMSCRYCGGVNKTKGIDRIDNKIGYTKENSVSCCKLCNYMKNNYSVDDFLAHIKKIYEHNLCQK